MRSMIGAAAAALSLAGCSEEAAPPAPQEERAAPAPGQYQVSWTVEQLQSTDKTTPATKLQAGATGTTSACIAADGKLAPALFSEEGDSCTEENSYVSGGRINLQLSCTRPGDGGRVMQSVNGTSTADGFEAEVSTTTYLLGRGDYAMTRKMTATRTGECAAGAEGGAAQAAGGAEG